MNKEILFEDIKCGNLSAFEALFRQYYPSMCVIAGKLVANREVAEDIVQDVFIRLWEKRTQTSLQATTFKSFLYTSVRNLAFDRMEKKDPLRHATDLKSSDKAWEEYDTLEEEVLARVKNEIDKLPERSRQIMQCIYLQGLHYKETAAKLGISIATVNTLLVNALKKIRQAYPDITQNIILFLLLSDKKKIKNQKHKRLNSNSL